MNTFNFCWTILAIESGRTNVFLNKDNCSVQNNYEEDFDKPIKRVAYLFKYGSFNIHFFNHCLSNFIAKVSGSLKIIDKICLTKNLNICSLSTGPGTNVIGFLYALHLLGKSLTGSVNYKFISKHVAWRNMVCDMFGSVPLNAPKPMSCKLIQCDVLTEINPKAQNYIKIADILFLCHSVFSTSDNTEVTDRVSNNILQHLKPGALVFFIFKEDISKNLKELTTFGHFLFGPTEITLEKMTYDKMIPAMLQVPVVDSGSAFFGVWQKSNSNLNQDNSSTLKHLDAMPISVSSKPLNDINIIKSDRTQSVSQLTDSFKPATSDSKLTEDNQAHSVKKMPHSPSTSTNSVIDGQKNETSKNKSTNPESSLNSLVKTLDRLVTNLEEFVNSRSIAKNPHNQQCFFTCPCHTQNMHAENWNTRHFNSCVKNRFHSPCVENHHICSNSSSFCNCSMSNKHNLCQNVRSQTPHIVIPLHNTTETGLAQVFSFVSQLNNSSN